MARKIRKVTCTQCSTEFYARSVLAKYCSKSCSHKAFRSKEPTQADLKKLFEQQNGIQSTEEEDKVDD